MIMQNLRIILTNGDSKSVIPPFKINEYEMNVSSSHVFVSHLLAHTSTKN